MTQTATNTQTEAYLPILNDFMPLYTTVGHAELVACHHAAQTGVRTGAIHKKRSSKWCRLAFERSEEAERTAEHLFSLTDRQMIEYPLIGLSDFTLATLHSIFLEAEVDTDEQAMLSRRMDEIHLAILDSPTAEPLLDYGWIFMDAVQYLVPDRLNRDPLKLLRRSLAHEIFINQGTQVVSILHHMASLHAAYGMFDKALDIHVAVLKHDPRRFESFFELALDLGNAKEFAAAVKVASRGLGILASTRQKSRERSMGDDLAMSMNEWVRRAQEGSETEASKSLMKRIESAMYTSSLDATPLSEVVAELVPDLDKIPVKRKWEDDVF